MDSGETNIEPTFAEVWNLSLPSGDRNHCNDDGVKYSCGIEYFKGKRPLPKMYVKYIDQYREQYSGRGLLESALLRQNEKHVQFLIDADIDVKSSDYYGNVPLHRQSNLSCKKLLHGAGADPHAVNKDGKGVLHVCSDPESFQWFLKLGVNPNAVDKDGRTPLHYLCGIQDYRFFAGSCLDINLSEFDKLQRKKMIQMLIHARADLSVRYERLKTPIHYAVETGRKLPLSAIRELVVAGVTTEEVVKPFSGGEIVIPFSFSRQYYDEDQQKRLDVYKKAVEYRKLPEVDKMGIEDKLSQQMNNVTISTQPLVEQATVNGANATQCLVQQMSKVNLSNQASGAGGNQGSHKKRKKKKKKH